MQHVVGRIWSITWTYPRALHKGRVASILADVAMSLVLTESDVSCSVWGGQDVVGVAWRRYEEARE